MAVTPQEFAEFMEPGISNIWADAFAPEASKYPQVFNIRDMAKQVIEDVKWEGFGQLQTQNDGDEFAFDDPITPVSKTYTYLVRALGYKVTDRMIRNELYDQVQRLEDMLLDSAKDDAEVTAWSVLINGFSGGGTGFDALQLFSNIHPNQDGSGTTQSNRPATDEALSLSALHNAIIQIKKWRNERNRPRVHIPKTLIIPTDLIITADELLGSTLKPGTALNDDNVIRKFNITPMEVEQLTSTTAWFLASEQHDLNFFWKFRPETDMVTEFKTDSILRKVRQGHVAGHGEWRGIYGTDGVA